MFNFFGNGSGSFCDGITRRNFLSIGGTAMAGLSLPQLLRAEEAAAACCAFETSTLFWT